MKYQNCTKCGSTHKRKPFQKNGYLWCAHCGTKVCKAYK